VRRAGPGREPRAADAGARYVALALRLRALAPDLVDYAGPPRDADTPPGRSDGPAGGDAPTRGFAALADEAAEQREHLAGVDDDQRRRWLEAQLAGIENGCRALGGERLSYRELFRRCHNLEAVVRPDAHFEAAHARLDEVLPGRGHVRERYAAWREGLRVPPEQVGPALRALLDELQARTRAAFGLPDGETVELELVEQQSWMGYAEPRDALSTRILVNTGFPLGAYELIEIVTHEAYPGHHTEHVLKSRLGRPELAAFVYPTPQAVISEGIGQLALEALLGTEADAIAVERLRPLGLDYDPETCAVVRDALNALIPVRSNLAIALEEGRLDGRGAREYARTWLVDSDERVERIVSVIEGSPWPPYESCYPEGLAVCRAYVKRTPDGFRRLLSEQVTTAELVIG
jgi:hypothetical protein